SPPTSEAGFLAAKTTATAAEDVTYLYQKVGAQGEHLKFGITKNPATRYTQEELAGGRLKILTEGPRKDMLQLECNLHETLPIGPEEAQNFYILHPEANREGPEAASLRSMKYQLVLQWPASSIKDYDAMIEVEDALIEKLSKANDVDGHDAG